MKLLSLQRQQYYLRWYAKANSQMLVPIPATANIPADAQRLDLNGYTVLPGLVGMHNHMFFPMGGSPPMYSNMGISFPRLYLALGVTTIRTTGSVVPYADLEIKRLIDAGRMIWTKDAHAPAHRCRRCKTHGQLLGRSGRALGSIAVGKQAVQGLVGIR